MRRAALLTTIVVLLVAPAGGDADARRRRRHRHRRPASPTQLMPPGWTWPPSPVMLEEGLQCLARLDELGVAWKPGPALDSVTTPVLVPGMELGGVRLVPLSSRAPLVMDCHLAEGLASAGGAALRSAGVRELRFSGIHSYRNVRRTRVLSRHAVGLAIDVHAFVFDDGEVVPVSRKAYRPRDSRLRQVERAVRSAGLFKTTLTPGSDPRRHHNHFHIEARTQRERPRALQPPRPLS